MQQVEQNQKQQFKGRLARTVLLTLLPLSLLPILLMGALMSYSSYRLLENQYSNQLKNIVEVQRASITRLISGNSSFLDSLSSEKAFREKLDEVLAAQPGNPEFEKLRSQLLEVYTTISSSRNEPTFDFFLVALPDSSILVASQKEWEGQKLAGDGGVNEIITNKKSLAAYNSLAENEGLVIMTSKPYQDIQTPMRAALIGITKSQAAHQIVLSSAGLHSEARAYFVIKDGSFIGANPYQTGQLTALDPSQQQKIFLLPDGLGRVPAGRIELASFDDEAVIAYTTYIPEIEASLIFEIPKASVAAALFSEFPLVISILLVSLLLIFLVIGVATQRFIDPLLKLSETTKLFAAGEWFQRAEINREDEIGQLAFSFNQMADEFTRLYRSLENRVDEQTKEIKIAAEIARVASSAPTLKELLERTVHLIVERFEYDEASIFLLDEEGRHAVLYERAGQESSSPLQVGFRIDLDSNSMIGWAMENKQARVAGNVHEDEMYLSGDGASQILSEAVIPILMGEHLLGALDVKSSKENAFGPEQVTVLQTAANLIATGIYNARLLEVTQVNLEEASLLYHATRQIAQAETPDEIFYALIHALKQTTYQSITLAERNQLLSILSLHNPNLSTGYKKSITWTPIHPSEIEEFLPTGNPLIIPDFRQTPKLPVMLLKTLRDWRCQTAAFIPVRRAGELVALFVLGAEERYILTPTSIQPFANLAELTATALEKVIAIDKMQKRLTELEILSLVSEAISGQTDLDATFASIHAAVERSLKVSSFFIALYDQKNETIQIPYMYDSNSVQHIEPFPLGEGLTSILIRTKQPLMLVENTEQRSRELGAKLLGAPAKSWMGVPLIKGSDVLGAIVVQDLEYEHRFNEDDLRLLTLIGRQIAEALRNVQLLDQFRRQTERERVLNEATRKIRETMDMQTILATMAQELGKTLGAQRTRVIINSEAENHSLEGRNGKGQKDIDSPSDEKGEQAI
jgi:GAF domain-containing protein/HAMP domain-containing protein